MSTLHELEAEHGGDLAEHDYWAQARAQALRAWVRERDPERIGDVGCGSGYLTAALAADGYDACGLDIDADLIAVATARDTTATFEQGDAFDLPWGRDAFDCLIYADVLEHFNDPAPVLAEARRVLAPDGHLLCSLPAFRTLRGPHDDNQDHYDRYSPTRLRWLADRCGFAVTRTRYTNSVPLIPYAVTQRILQRDVPSSIRGESHPAVEWVKDRLLAAEQRLSLPGVTLIGELAPRAAAVGVSDVLLMNYEYPPRCGGGGVFTRDLANALQARGYRISLVTGGASSATRTQNSLSDLVQFPVRSLPELVQTVRRENPDLINAHFALPTAAALPAVARATDTPYVVNCMGADVFDPTRYRRLRPAMHALNRWGVLRSATRIITPSTDLRRRLPKGLRLKTEVVPYFVDTDRFHPPEDRTPGDPLRLLTVARLVPRKNLTTMLEAVAQLADDMAVEYSVVGSGSQLDPLREHATALGIADRVAFHGYVADEDLPAVYREHDVFVLPSLHEAFGIVFLEALASGLPVVTSDTGGQTDIVTDAVGRCVPPRDVGGLADAVRDVAATYDELARNARPYVADHYTEAHVVHEYDRIYRSVIA